MTKRNDFISELEDYLVDFDGETPLPERVRDALDAELPGTHQVRPGAGRWKGPTMTSTTPKIARWGLVAAGLVVAVGLGAAIMLPGRDIGVGAAVASPTAAPTPAPTPTLSPSAASTITTLDGATYSSCPDSPAATCIEPGTYQLGDAAPGGLIDVPAGWFEWDYGPGSVGLLIDRSDVPNGSGWGFVLSQVGEVYRDPCDRSAGMHAPAEVDTPAELAAAMGAWPDFEATLPVSTTIGGIAGVRTRLSTALSTATCTSPVLWVMPSDFPVDSYPMVEGTGHPADFAIIDLDGQLLVVRSMASASTSPFERAQGIAEDPTRHEADLVTQQTVIDSIRFDGAAP